MCVCGHLVSNDRVVFCYTLPQCCVPVRQIPCGGSSPRKLVGKLTLLIVTTTTSPIPDPGPGSRQAPTQLSGGALLVPSGGALFVLLFRFAIFYFAFCLCNPCLLPAWTNISGIHFLLLFYNYSCECVLLIGPTNLALFG